MDIQYEKDAMYGRPMPRGLRLIDQLSYQGLCWIYARYRAGYITREQGTEEKRKLLIERERAKEEWDAREKLLSASAGFYKSVERYMNQYAKERTLEHAEQLYAAVNGGLRCLE